MFVNKISLARDYCIEETLVPSLNTYEMLGGSIALQEVGLERILNMAQVRENMVSTNLR